MDLVKRCRNRGFVNVLDKYKSWEVDLIREDVQKHTLPYACMMSHVDGDFNLGTVLRNANAFGCKELFYYGKKNWDRRSSVGTQHYSQFTHLKSIDEIIELKKKYRFVGVECNIDRYCQNFTTYDIQPNSLFIFGEESKGLSDEILDLCDEYVFIPMIGSVRSLNVGVASGIIMNSVMNKLLDTN